MKCKISLAIGAQCFESEKNEAERGDECGMFGVTPALEPCMISEFLSLSCRGRSSLLRLAGDSDTVPQLALPECNLNVHVEPCERHSFSSVEQSLLDKILVGRRNFSRLCWSPSSASERKRSARFSLDLNVQG